MINLTRQGQALKIGLNLYRSPGGFVAVWAWYNFGTREGTMRRLRIRLHIKPRILWSVETFNVIDDYLLCMGLELVHREVLQDLKACEETAMRRNDAYIKGSYAHR